MSGRTRAIILGSVALAAIGVLSIFLALTTTAAPTAATAGAVTTDPAVVSPNNAISTGSRAITITVIDPDLNAAAFVGSGPNGESATFDQISDPDNPGLGTPAPGDGERIEVTVNTIGSTFTIALTANPITVVGAGTVIGTNLFTPLADRNGDGAVTVADIEIVIPDGTSVVADDVQVLAIVGDPRRGLVVFRMIRAGLQGEFFDVRYASSNRELTRANKQFIEALTIPAGGVVDGEAFTLTLDIDHLPIQDANGDAVLSSADITLSIPGHGTADTPRVVSLGGIATLANPAIGLAAGDTITLVHSGDALASGSQINVTYLGLEDLVTVRGVNGVNIPLRLRETGVDTGVFKATIISVGGVEADRPNGHLDPTLITTNIATADGHGVARGNVVGFALLSVIDNGFITVTYRDRTPVTTVTARVRVKSNGPVFSNISPADGTTTHDANTLLRADLSDAVAGVDPTTGTSINVVFGTDVGGASISGDQIVGPVITTGGVIVRETFAGSNVYRVQYSISNVPEVAAALAAGVDIVGLQIVWQVLARDRAGNPAASAPRSVTLDTTLPPPPVIVIATADFSAAPRQGLAPLAVSFTDESTISTGQITAWLWDFGDGGTSTGQSPSYTYHTPGTYSVSLLVIGDGVQSQAVKTDYIKAVEITGTRFSEVAIEVLRQQVELTGGQQVIGAFNLDAWDRVEIEIEPVTPSPGPSGLAVYVLLATTDLTDLEDQTIGSIVRSGDGATGAFIAPKTATYTMYGYVREDATISLVVTRYIPFIRTAGTPDVNGDGVVNFLDLIIVAQNFGRRLGGESRR